MTNAGKADGVSDQPTRIWRFHSIDTPARGQNAPLYGWEESAIVMLSFLVSRAALLAGCLQANVNR